MIKYLLLIFIPNVLSMCNSNKNLIKNFDIPSCKDCVHFKPLTSYELARCSLFGEKNIITDKIDNYFAERCREDDNKCGIIGKYFEEVSLDKKIIRESKNFFNENLFASSFIFGIFVSILSSIIGLKISK